MQYFELAGGPGKGLHPAQQLNIPMINKTGSTLTKGAVVLVDEDQSDADSTNLTPGADGSGYRHVVTPRADQTLCHGTFMMYQGVEGSLVDNAEGLFALVGIFECDIETGAVALDDLLTAKAGLELDIHATLTPITDGQKIIAKPVATRASGSALVRCFFNGYGFATGTTT